MLIYHKMGNLLSSSSDLDEMANSIDLTDSEDENETTEPTDTAGTNVYPDVPKITAAESPDDCEYSNSNSEEEEADENSNTEDSDSDQELTPEEIKMQQDLERKITTQTDMLIAYMKMNDLDKVKLIREPSQERFDYKRLQKALEYADAGGYLEVYDWMMDRTDIPLTRDMLLNDALNKRTYRKVDMYAGQLENTLKSRMVRIRKGDPEVAEITALYKNGIYTKNHNNTRRAAKLAHKYNVESEVCNVENSAIVLEPEYFNVVLLHHVMTSTNTVTVNMLNSEQLTEYKQFLDLCYVEKLPEETNKPTIRLRDI